MNLKILRTSNKRVLEEIQKKLESASQLRVGWFSSAKYFNEGNGRNYDGYVAHIAYVNEFGLKTPQGNYVPPRPFMRPAAKDNAGNWGALFARDIKNKSVKDSLDRLGLKVEGDIRKSITAVWQPCLAPITLYNRLKKQGIYHVKTKDYKERVMNTQTPTVPEFLHSRLNKKGVHHRGSKIMNPQSNSGQKEIILKEAKIWQKVEQVYNSRQPIAKPLIDTGYMIESITHEVD